jgi:uncharacterized secreted protein with C-terminal beta-propeller domain
MKMQPFLFPKRVIDINQKFLRRKILMKKRILTIILAVSMLLSLVACGNTETDEKENDNENENVIETQQENGFEAILNTNPGAHMLASDYGDIFDLIMELNARNEERYGVSNRATRGEWGEDEVMILEQSEEVPMTTTAAPMGDSIAPAAEMSFDDSDMGGAENYAMYDSDGESAMGGGGEGSAEYSDTNVQVEGVQESDIVKTDGKHIFIASRIDNSINIIKPDNGNMDLVAKIQKDNNRDGNNFGWNSASTSIEEMLLYDGKLITIWNKWEQFDTPQHRMYDYWGWGWGWNANNETIVEVYDINGTFEFPISTYSQSGRYNSSRMIGNNIYVISSFNPPMPDDLTREDFRSYIPTYSINDDEYLVPANVIALPERIEQIEYTIIGGLDVNSPDLMVSISANIGGTFLIYASLNNIYLTRTEYDYGDDWGWNWWDSYTVINKFSIGRGYVTFVNAGRVKGSIETQFYLDEHNGFLRVVTQVWGEMEPSEDEWWRNWGPHGASLYTMDEHLNVLDEMHGIGFGENVQSVRFEGDIGYIVTFFMVDPLFSFDLSNPWNIVMLDELKIPGFSRYMHRWADGLLLGIGVEANEEDGMRTGLKVSMFDTSDNENLFERHVYIITDGLNNSNQDWWSDDWSWSWFWSPAEWEHKSILICTDKNIIAFPYSYSFSSNNYWHSEYHYVVFSYDPDAGFTMIGTIEYDTGDDNNWWHSGGFVRGLYIGDYLYVIAEDRIVSARLSDLSIVQELRFFCYSDIYGNHWDDNYWGEEVIIEDPVYEDEPEDDDNNDDEDYEDDYDDDYDDDNDGAGDYEDDYSTDDD